MPDYGIFFFSLRIYPLHQEVQKINVVMELCMQLMKKKTQTNPKLKKARNFQCKVPSPGDLKYLILVGGIWYLSPLRYYKNRHVISKVLISFLSSQQ